jgi:tRNA threonylcarbamoyladenosine biosynthesis protein TsaB
MRRLVIDTATEYLSVALFCDEKLIASSHGKVGRGHAELLLPAISELPDGGRADEIWVGCGPGSFTGTRIGIAAARALAFAWSAELWGFNTVDLIAADAADMADGCDMIVAVEGGHGEWLVATYASGATERTSGPISLVPEDAARLMTIDCVAGQKAVSLVAIRGNGKAISGTADTRKATRLRLHQLFANVQPIYARKPDAAIAGVSE